MYNKLTLLLALAPLVSLMTGMGHSEAQTPDDVSVALTAGQSESTVGDVISLTLTATYPEDYQVVFPRLTPTWGAFEVRGQSRVSTIANEDGTETTSQLIEAALYAPGTYETPDLQVTVRDPTGQITEHLATPVSLTVVSVLAEGDDKLRDIKPQAGLLVPWVWPWIVGGVLLVGLIGGGIYLLLKRRILSQPDPVLNLDTRSPYQIAQDELTQIEELDLPGQAHFKEHYTLVADCVRRYLEGEYRVTALDRTTVEVRMTLEHTFIAPDDSRQVVELLRDCDLVKFAKLTPEVASARQCTMRTRQLIELLRPAVEPVAATVDELVAEVRTE